MADLGVRLVIEAENNASAAIDQTQQAFNRMMDAVKAGNAEAAKFADQLLQGKRSSDDLARSYGELTAKAEQLQQTTTRHTASIGANYRETRLLAGIMASELTPALGGVESALVRV